MGTSLPVTSAPPPTSPAPPPPPTRMAMCWGLDRVHTVLTSTLRGAETQRGSVTRPRTHSLCRTLHVQICTILKPASRGRGHRGSVHTQALPEGPSSYGLSETHSLPCHSWRAQPFTEPGLPLRPGGASGWSVMATVTSETPVSPQTHIPAPRRPGLNVFLKTEKQ